jgi:segregation and condensation protein B
MDQKQIKNIVEAGLLAVGGPLSVDQLQGLFGTDVDSVPEKKDIRDVLAILAEEYEGRGIQLLEVASGFRIQVRKELSEWISRLWLERPPRYSRALLETLSIIAYRQPVTRGEIEDVRGVAVSTNIVRTLLDRNWIRVLGSRDVPGKPSIYGTTKEFLDYFGLKGLSDLPTLADISDLDNLNVELDLPDPDVHEPGVSASENSRQENGDSDPEQSVSVMIDDGAGDRAAEAETSEADNEEIELSSVDEESSEALPEDDDELPDTGKA